MTATMVEPGTIEELATAVGDLGASGRGLEVRGGGSVLDRLPGRDAPVVSTAGLTGVVAHAASDLTVTVRAGTRIEELASVLAEHGQECPIEPAAGAGSTVGGRVATALAGPRQLGAGRVRDWVLRLRFVTGEGISTTVGGVTVKDVTGFDLCRLLTGSWGTIGVIAEVTLKLRPLTRHTAWYVTDGPQPDLDGRLFRPAGLFTTRERTHVLLEGHPDDVAEQATSTGLIPGEAPHLPTVARASVDPARLDELRAALLPLEVEFATQDAVGVGYLDGPADALGAARTAAAHLGGSLLVLDPDRGLPAFGANHEPDVMSARVMAALDPQHVLAPWRWQQ